MIEKKLVTAGRAKLPALLEEDADFRRGAVVIVGQDLDDNRHLVGRVTFKDDVLHHHFFAADACALLDRALDHIT